jgi:hypothetical protein
MLKQGLQAGLRGGCVAGERGNHGAILAVYWYSHRHHAWNKFFIIDANSL